MEIEWKREIDILMKRRLKYILIICLSILALAFCGLGKNVVLADESTHTVTFSFNISRIKKYIIDDNNEILGNLNDVTQYVSHDKFAIDPDLVNDSILKYYTYRWTVNGESVNLKSYQITKDTEFVAEWIPVTYKVYFNYSDFGSEIINKVDYEEFTVESARINLYTPIRPNYIFKGWYENANDEGSIACLYISPKSCGDRVLHAVFTPAEYYIDYHTSAEHNNPRGYNVEDDNIILEEPTLYGHIFKGWYTDTSYSSAITTINCSEGGNINLYARWELETYDVTYILPNGLTKTVTAEYGTTAKLPSLDKSIFEIVKTNVSRKNITKDTVIEIEYVNIWYVYIIAIVTIGGLIAIIIILKKKRDNTHNNLRTMYYSNVKGKRK